MSTTPDTILQRTRQVGPADALITVRRMRWKPAVAFITQLAGHFGQLKQVIAAMQAPGPEGETKEQKNTRIMGVLLPELASLVTSVGSLTDFLIEHSTDLKPEQREQLDLGDALEVVRAALELNVGDDLKKSFGGIAAALSTLATSAKSTAKPTTS